MTPLSAQTRPGNLGRLLFVLAALVGSTIGLVSAVSAGSVTRPAITQNSIAGATLGLPQSNYEQLLGQPFHTSRGTPQNPGQPDNYSRLAFSKRKLSVYFVDGADKGVVVATWNKAYRTAAGIGPCSTIRRLKRIYGKRLKPSKFNTQHGVVSAYTLGKNLIFATNNQVTVDAVGLYDGSDPHANESGGSLSYAGFITLSEKACL